MPTWAPTYHHAIACRMMPSSSDCYLITLYPQDATTHSGANHANTHQHLVLLLGTQLMRPSNMVGCH